MAHFSITDAIRLSLRALGVATLLASAGFAHAEPQRIVSVGGATTEILYRLDAQDRVIAVDTTSLYPPEALATKPNVGYMRALSAEGVLAISPDLILMEENSGPPEAVGLISRAGIPVVHIPAGFKPDDLPRKVRAVATAIGKAADGERLADETARGLAALKRDLAAVTQRKRVLFILSLVDGRPMAAGTGTAADSITALAGGINVFADIEGYKTVSPEAAAALQPDVILMVNRGGAPDASGDLLSQPAFAATPAGKSGALIKMDALYLLGFGPRTPAAARELAAKFYPDLKLAGVN